MRLGAAAGAGSAAALPLWVPRRVPWAGKRWVQPGMQPPPGR